MNIWSKLGPTAKRHMQAICDDAVTKTNVIGLRKAFNHIARLDGGLSGNRSNITFSESDALNHALEHHQPKVTGELHETGLKLLRGKRYARRLEPVADIIADIQCFRLIGFDWLDNYHCVPVYRAIARDGRKFTFRNVPWQSGGNGPEIL